MRQRTLQLRRRSKTAIDVLVDRIHYAGPREGLELATEALGAHPDDPLVIDAYLSAGTVMLHHESGLEGEARDSLRKGVTDVLARYLELVPDSYVRRLREAWVLVALEEYLRAAEVHRSLARSREAKRSVTLRSIHRREEAHCHAALGDYGKALRVIDESLALTPRHLPSRILKGQLLELTGDSKGALECMRQSAREISWAGRRGVEEIVERLSARSDGWPFDL